MAERDGIHHLLSERIIGAAIEVHRALGPGLLESAYEACLAKEFARQGISFRRQVELPLVYKDELVDCGFRLDFLVEDLVIVELKAVDQLLSIHDAQLLTYLKLAKLRLGLLINFNARVVADGVRRKVL
jgi:GxxExxY protein